MQQASGAAGFASVPTLILSTMREPGGASEGGCGHLETRFFRRLNNFSDSDFEISLNCGRGKGIRNKQPEDVFLRSWNPQVYVR